VKKIFLSDLSQIISSFSCTEDSFRERLLQYRLMGILPFADKAGKFSTNNAIISQSDYLFGFFDPEDMQSVWNFSFAVQNNIPVFAFYPDITNIRNLDPFVFDRLQTIHVYSTAEGAFKSLMTELQTELAESETVLPELSFMLL